MKLLIAGSRDITDIGVIPWLVFNHLRDNDIWEIISGGARGVASEAERLANEHGINFKLFKADWDNLGKLAGYVRNAKMVNYCDIALIVWDGKSKGTKHTIDLLDKANKPYVLVRR